MATVSAAGQDRHRLPRHEDFVGTLSCTSASCHGAIEPPGRAGGPQRQEYLHWLGAEALYRDGRRHYDPRAQAARTFADPHALAARRIESPRFREILSRASGLPAGKTDPQMAARCAGCHDPAGIASAGGPEAFQALLAAGDRPPERGIACESCHGGARQWLASHYERDVRREELLELGMVDTKNILARARLCSACHVGSAANDMNHDMIAAGHPPLRFELASYHALIERKHWDDGPRRQAQPDYEAQLWAAGRVAAAEAALALLNSRADRAVAAAKAGGDAAWPEFAEYNCLACHQPLRAGGQPLPADRSGDLATGVPPWQTWNLALAEPVLKSSERAGSDDVLPQSRFGVMLWRLQRNMGRSLTPPPDEIFDSAYSTRHVLRKYVQVSPSGEILNERGQPFGAADVLAALDTADQPPSWERACHELAAILAVERSLRDWHSRQTAAGLFSTAASQQFARTTGDVRRRAAQVARSLRFLDDRQWPAALADPLTHRSHPASTMSLEECSRELAALRKELARLVEVPDP